MILMRHGMNVVRLNQSGIPPDRRFSFYDQIHTTGMDIHQCIDAKAVLTLGKDMTFRDYAQGAFRMRGIGKGQTIELFIIPEIMKLIQDQQKRLTNRAPEVKPIVDQSTKSPFDDDLLSMSYNQAPATSTFLETQQYGVKLLVNVSSWLVVNGMKSENSQFNMLCHQSVENVFRKRAFHILNESYKELTQLAFADRVKEIA